MTCYANLKAAGSGCLCIVAYSKCDSHHGVAGCLSFCLAKSYCSGNYWICKSDGMFMLRSLFWYMPFVSDITLKWNGLNFFPLRELLWYQRRRNCHLHLLFHSRRQCAHFLFGSTIIREVLLYVWQAYLEYLRLHWELMEHMVDSCYQNTIFGLKKL
jgi:hypothetical protein